MNDPGTIIAYLAFPLVLTVVMETPVLLIGFRNEKFNIKYKLLVFILVNLITNLTLNGSVLVFRPDLKIVIAAEILIVIAEALVYQKAFITKYGKALPVSFLANAFSGIIGSYLLTLILN